MSGIAEILHDQGYKVRGSDSAENAQIEIGLNFKPEEMVG